MSNRTKCSHQNKAIFRSKKEAKQFLRSTRVKGRTYTCSHCGFHHITTKYLGEKSKTKNQDKFDKIHNDMSSRALERHILKSTK